MRAEDREAQGAEVARQQARASFLLQMISLFYTPEHLLQASVCTGPAQGATMLAPAHPLLPSSPDATNSAQYSTWVERD